VEDDNGDDINLRKPDPPCPHCERLRDAAEKARTAVMAAGYLRLEPDLTTAIQDVLTDLRHLYDDVPISGIREPWENVVRRADTNYHEEVAGTDDDDKTCGGPHDHSS
jgi:hypothetical protein